MALISVGILEFATGGSGPTANGTLTIDHNKCGTADTPDYTVWVNITNNKLKTVANGGNVVNASGFDIVFTSDVAGTLIMPFQQEIWNGTTGNWQGWVRLVAGISHTVDTVFYINIGNAAYTTFQGGAAGAAWNSDYKGIWHFPDGTTLSGADSTTFGNTATITGITAGAGLLDGAASISLGNAISMPNAAQYNSTTGTWSLWFNTTESVAGGYKLLMSRADAGSTNGITISMSQTAGEVFIQIYNNSTPVIGALSGGPAVNDGAWHNMTFTFNGPSVATLYVDGVSVATATPTLSWTFGNQPVALAKSSASFWQPYSGLMDECRIYDIQLSASNITADFNSQKNPGTFITVVL